MTWLRVDDGFPQHPKVVQLARSERWTWLEILAYCARYRTCGKVPAAVREVVGAATPKLIEKLVDVHLLDVDEDGWKVHDWDDYNPKDPTAADRAKRYRNRDADRDADRDGNRDGERDEHRDADRDESRDENVTVTAPRARASAAVPVPSPTPITTTAVAKGLSLLAVDLKTEQHLERIGFSPQQILKAFDRPLDELAAWIKASEAPTIDKQGAWLWNRLESGQRPPTVMEVPSFRCDKCAGLSFKTERRLTEHMENVHDQPLKEATA